MIEAIPITTCSPALEPECGPCPRTGADQGKTETFINPAPPEGDPEPVPSPEHALIGRSVLQTRHRTRAVVQVGPDLCVHRCTQCRSACPKSIGRVAARNGGWRRNFSQLVRPAQIRA